MLQNALYKSFESYLFNKFYNCVHIIATIKQIVGFF